MVFVFSPITIPFFWYVLFFSFLTISVAFSFIWLGSMGLFCYFLKEGRIFSFPFFCQHISINYSLRHVTYYSYTICQLLHFLYKVWSVVDIFLSFLSIFNTHAWQFHGVWNLYESEVKFGLGWILQRKNNNNK